MVSNTRLTVYDDLESMRKVVVIAYFNSVCHVVLHYCNSVCRLLHFLLM